MAKNIADRSSYGSKWKNIRIEAADHKVLKIIGAYTGKSNKDLFAEAMPLLAAEYPELSGHYPEGY